MDTKSWTRSPKSSKAGHKVRKVIKTDTKSEKADATPNVLICRRPASLLGRLLVALPDVGSVARAIVACWGMPRPQCEASKAPVGHVRAYRDTLSDALAALSIIRRARRLRTLLVRLSSAGESIEDPVGVDKLVVSHGETIVRTMCGGLGVSEKLALPRKVDRPSGHGSPCRGGRVKVAVGLPAKEVCRSWFVETRWDPRVLMDFVEARARGRARKDSSGTQADSMDCSSKPSWRMAWSSCTMYGFSATGTVLSRDGAPRFKGVNSLKPSGILFEG
ncbi:hypothetical protein CRG98_034638 [Punica granatum]|uniref:Uncharacterized protein n=1 Tax=Punica granatum TaxID=22663 RepID=A0A2I0IML4_PUNGR|nr:hypothetical protein CRG98_034638 [Punica granatum]